MSRFVRHVSCAFAAVVFLAGPSVVAASPILLNPGPLGAITNQLEVNVLTGVVAELGPTVGTGGTFSLDFLFNGKAIQLGNPRTDLFSQLELVINPTDPTILLSPTATSIYLLDQQLDDLGVGGSQSATHYGYGMVWNLNSSDSNVSGKTFYGLHVEGTLPTYVGSPANIADARIKFGPFGTFDPDFYGTIIESQYESSQEASPVPEPGTLALVGVGALVSRIWARVRRGRA